MKRNIPLAHILFTSVEKHIKKSLSVTTQTKAIEEGFPLVLFILLYKMVLIFGVCGWNPKGWPFKRKLLKSNFLWYCLAEKGGGFNFWVYRRKPIGWPFKRSPEGRGKGGRWLASNGDVLSACHAIHSARDMQRVTCPKKACVEG